MKISYLLVISIKRDSCSKKFVELCPLTFRMTDIVLKINFHVKDTIGKFTSK